MKEVKVWALAICQEYHSKLEALAEEKGKTLGVLLEAVGDVVHNNRGLNRWNAFQAYAIRPDGLAMEQKVEQTEGKFQEEIRELYLWR